MARKKKTSLDDILKITKVERRRMKQLLIDQCIHRRRVLDLLKSGGRITYNTGVR